MRLPYVQDPPQTTSAEEAEIVTRVQARRAPGPLQPIDLALLHAPYIAAGWASFLGAVRNHSSLPADIRELSILRVAALCRCKYELIEHSPYVRQAGVSEEGINAALGGKKEGLNEKQWAAVRFAESMTKNVKVPKNVFEGIRRYLNDQQIVEITATVAALNCAARFLVALDVGEFDEQLSISDVE
jgi:AhpD family alkylhydroperoxidase